MESFPRIRKNYFTRPEQVVTIPEQLGGRLEIYAGTELGTPEVYTAIARANGMMNVTSLRATLRPTEESIRNELILRGYSGIELERKYEEAMDEASIGDRDWQWYDDFTTGVVTDAQGGMTIGIPSADETSQWYNAYRELK